MFESDMMENIAAMKHDVEKHLSLILSTLEVKAKNEGLPMACLSNDAGLQDQLIITRVMLNSLDNIAHLNDLMKKSFNGELVDLSNFGN